MARGHARYSQPRLKELDHRLRRLVFLLGAQFVNPFNAGPTNPVPDERRAEFPAGTLQDTDIFNRGLVLAANNADGFAVANNDRHEVVLEASQEFVGIDRARGELC